MSDDQDEQAQNGGDKHATIDQLMRAKHRAHMRLFVSFVVSIVLFGILAFHQESQTRQIQHNSDQLGQVQERTSDDVLCPLYTYVLHVIKHPLPARVNTAQERKANREALNIFQSGYDALDCPAGKANNKK